MRNFAPSTSGTLLVPLTNINGTETMMMMMTELDHIQGHAQEDA